MIEDLKVLTLFALILLFFQLLNRKKVLKMKSTISVYLKQIIDISCSVTINVLNSL